jgi:hypothetical protein
MAATAAAKPQATIVVQGGVATKYAGTRPKSDFLSPEPDDDFIDPGDDYRMPWECDPDGGADNRDLPESADKDTDSFAASIGLEVFGSVRFIDMVDALLEEYADVFSTELGIEPADLPPLDVEIVVKNYGIAPRTKDVHVLSLLKVSRRYVGTLKNSLSAGRSYQYYMHWLTLRCCWSRNRTLMRSG